MNKAILIVICDFLVSAMLTMMTGMVPAHTGGTGVGLDENTTKLLLSELDAHRSELEKLRLHLRETIENSGANSQLEAQLKAVTDKLAENRLQQEKLLIQLNATPANTGKLSEKELQKRLDEEKKRRITMEIELKDRHRELLHTREKLGDARETIKINARDLAASRRDLSRTREALAKTSEALVDMTHTHVETQRKLARAESAVEDGKAEIKRKNMELDQKTRELRINAARLNSVQGENKSMQSKLAYTTGQLRIRERDYAGIQDKLARAEGELMTERLTAAEMRARSEELGKTLKSAVAQLSVTTEELNKVRTDKTVAETKLSSVKEITEKLIKESSNKRSEVIARYGTSVVNLNCRVSEEKIFGQQQGTGSFYLPVVDFNGKKLIIGTLNKFAGDAETALSFNKVTEVTFFTRAPGAAASQLRLPGPLMVLRQEMRAAAFEYNGSDRKPLPLLDMEALKKRGLDGLYLFKCGSLGRESTLLDGRCSISMAPGDRQLFIRNAGRANNELKAEPGDFILSRQGEFVGLVIDYDRAAFGRVRGAKALLFDSEKAWEDADQISILKKPGARYFDDFARAMSRIRKNFMADSRRR